MVWRVHLVGLIQLVGGGTRIASMWPASVLPWASIASEAVDAAVRAYGRVDVMINNAGLMPQSPLERLKVEEWDRMIDVNLKGVLYGIAVLPIMQRQKSGHIVNVSSVAGHKVGPGFAVYAATKHAVRALSEGLRQEVKPYNIRTTVISPGAVATELPNTVSDPAAAERLRKFNAEMAIPADSFARAVAYAISQPEEVDITRSCSARRARSCDAPDPLPGAASWERRAR